MRVDNKFYIMGCCSNYDKEKDFYLKEESGNSEGIIVEKFKKKKVNIDEELFKSITEGMAKDNCLDIYVSPLSLPDPDTSKSISSWKDSSKESTIKFNYFKKT